MRNWWKWVIPFGFLLVLLSSCDIFGGLNEEEIQEIRSLRNEIFQAINQEKADIMALVQKHKAGQLTTVELVNKIMEVKNKTTVLVREANATIEKIYEDAKERKVDWWKAALGMLATFVFPSPAGHVKRGIVKVFRKGAAA